MEQVEQEPAAAKHTLRKQIRALRREAAAAEGRERSERICRHVTASAEWRHAGVVMLYLPMPEEVDITRLLEDALLTGKTVCLPCVDDASNPAVRAVPVNRAALESLVPDALGMPVPADRSRSCPPAEIDLIVVPGVAFDLEGNRLGMGKGCYDRFLATVPSSVPRLSCAYDVQVVAAVPVEESDCRIDMLVTEQGFLFKNEHMCYNE